MIEKNKKEKFLLGLQKKPKHGEFSSEIAINDPKNKFILNHIRNKEVLDIGCVNHNPLNYQSKYWLHKLLHKYSKNVLGLDLSKEGVEYLNSIGYNVIHEDAENFDLNKTFDVIVAGDIIEHLNNPGEFLESCKRHMDKNSKLLITTPNPWYWKCFLKVFLFGFYETNAEHTCWFDPITLEQLLTRYNLKMLNFEYGSRYLIDKIFPFPKSLKNTSFYALIKLNDLKN